MITRMVTGVIAETNTRTTEDMTEVEAKVGIEMTLEGEQIPEIEIDRDMIQEMGPEKEI